MGSVPKTQLYFSIQTLQNMDGKSLKALTPDKNGVYHDVPVAVLDKVSRNNKYYEPDSVIKCIVDPSSRFNLCLREGALCGEYGHPFVEHNDSEIERIAKIEQTRVSHHFLKVYSKDAGDNVIIYTDLKPSGPYGDILDRDFKDPTLNNGFSLRSLCAKISMDGVVMRQKMLMLVTFDAETGCGYPEASKRYSLSNEGLSIETSIDALVANRSALINTGLESITNERVFDMLGTDKVAVLNKEELICEVASSKFYNNNGPVSLFHKLYGEV